MKSVKSKKQVLDISMLEEEFFENAILIGIVCPLESYRFVWKINQAFNYLFERNHECEIAASDLFFEVYNFEENEKMIEHFIYTNRKKTNFLLQEAKNIDFIWMIKGGYLSEFYTETIPSLLKKVQQIDHSFIINPSLLKSKQHLIL